MHLSWAWFVHTLFLWWTFKRRDNSQPQRSYSEPSSQSLVSLRFLPPNESTPSMDGFIPTAFIIVPDEIVALLLLGSPLRTKEHLLPERKQSFSLAPQLQTRQTPWWIHTVRFTKNINCRSFFIVSASCLSLILATLHWFPSFTVFIMLYNVTIHESVHCSLGEQHTIIFVKDSSINST